MGSIRFAGQLTEHDYRRISALAGRKVVLAWSALISVLFILLLARWSWDAFLAEPLFTALVFGSLLFVIPISLALRPLILRRHWRSNAILRQPIKGDVSDQGIAWDVDGVSSNQLPWDLLLHYRESAAAILVYVGIGQFLYFLPRYFSDQADWQRFKTLVATKLPRR